MKKAEVLNGLKTCESDMRARGAQALYIFGSVKHDQATPTSDVDLIVDYNPSQKFSLLDLVGMKLMLEDNLGHPVELLTRDGINHHLRDTILADAERVF